MKKTAIVVTLLLLGLIVHAQKLKLVDDYNLQPLSNAIISDSSMSVSITTDENGEADIIALKNSTAIRILLIGYQKKTYTYAGLEKAGFEVFLTRTSISLDQVVIGATKWDQPDRDVPAKVTVITSEAVALLNPQTAADMLGQSGEIFIQKSQQGGGSPMIRGFATNRVLIAVDGVRMNTAIFRSGNLQNVINVDPFAVEEAELIFGPGSVIYGSDAIAGVMSFNTLRPKLSTSDEPLINGSTVARYASANNELTGHFDVNVGWKKWSLLSSFSYNRFGDLRMGANGDHDEYLRTQYVQRMDSMDHVVDNDDPLVQHPTGYQQYNLMQKVRFSPNERWDLNYAFHYSTTTDYDRYDRLLRYRNGFPRSAEWNYGPQKWMLNNLSITHNAAKGPYSSMTLRLAHQLFEESRVDRNFNDTERRTNAEQVHAYSGNLDFRKNLGTRHTFFYGLEAIFNDVTSTGTAMDITTGIETPFPARYPMSNWSSYAVHATYQFKPIEKITLQGGIRYNYYMLNADFDTTFYPFPFTEAKLNNGAVTGSLGVVYNPTQRWSLSLNASTGFRSPNVDDVGKVFESEPGSVVVPNPDLKAEYAYNFELGIAKVFGEWVKVDITGFYTILDNALVRRDFQLNGLDSIDYNGDLSQVQAIQNAAYAKVYGVQAGLEVKFPLGFGISSRFNYQHGEEELDNGQVDPLRHSAPWFGITHVTYNRKRLTLDLYGMYSGEVSYENLADEERGKDYMYAIDANGNPYSPAWYTLNFKALYQFTENLSVSGGVENLSDLRYRPYSSGMVAAGRNFILSLRAAF